MGEVVVEGGVCRAEDGSYVVMCCLRGVESDVTASEICLWLRALVLANLDQIAEEVPLH